MQYFDRRKISQLFHKTKRKDKVLFFLINGKKNEDLSVTFILRDNLKQRGLTSKCGAVCKWSTCLPFKLADGGERVSLNSQYR